MKEKLSAKLPPLREPYKLSEDQSRVVERFKEELVHRLGGISVAIEIFKEHLLAYPSLHGDTIHFEVRVGNWRRVQVISEMELENTISGSFYYFCRRLVDATMADLLRIGAARA